MIFPFVRLNKSQFVTKFLLNDDDDGLQIFLADFFLIQPGRNINIGNIIERNGCFDPDFIDLCLYNCHHYLSSVFRLGLWIFCYQFNSTWILFYQINVYGLVVNTIYYVMCRTFPCTFVVCLSVFYSCLYRIFQTLRMERKILITLTENKIYFWGEKLEIKISIEYWILNIEYYYS